jgi:hypothetical protein
VAPMFQANDLALRKRHKLDATYWTACSAVVTTCVWAYRYPFNTLQMLIREDQTYPSGLVEWLPHVAELCLLFVPLLVSVFLFHISQSIAVEFGDGSPVAGVESTGVSTGSSGRVDSSTGSSGGGQWQLNSVGLGRVPGGTSSSTNTNTPRGVGAGLKRLVQEWVPSKYLSLYNPPIINIDTPVGVPPVVDIAGLGGSVGASASGHGGFSSNYAVNYDAGVASALLGSPAGARVDTADGVAPSSGTDITLFNATKLTDANKTQFVSRYQKQQGGEADDDSTVVVARSSSHHLHRHHDHQMQLARGGTGAGSGGGGGGGGAASRIAYKSAPTTIGAGDELYYQLPSSANILATLPGGFSGDALLRLQVPTAVHGYSNKPLHVTTALFGVISSSVTSTNAVNLMNSLNDNTLDMQQLLALGKCLSHGL